MRIARILIVEDSEFDRVLLGDFFSRERFCNELIYAASLKEARQKIADSRPDLIFLDVHLPDGEGLDLAEELRQEKIPIPAICLSGSNSPEIIEKASDASVLAFIEKPLNFELFREVMQRLDSLYLAMIINEGGSHERLENRTI